MHRGYIALWRKIDDHPFYKEPREFSKYEAWIDILKEAQHSMEPQEVVFGMSTLTCNYGECLKSTQTWASKWMWSRSKVFRFLKLLKKMGQIDFRSETITTRIIVINYKDYDPKRNANETEVKRSRNGSETESNTDNNDNNVKNDNTSKSPNGFLSEKPTKKPNCPYQKIVGLYREILPELPQPPDELTPDFKKTMKARWKEHPDVEWFEWYFRSTRDCPWLMGVGSDWQASLDWLLGPKNMTKVLNGRYLKRGKTDRLKTVGEQWLKKQREKKDS